MDKQLKNLHRTHTTWESSLRYPHFGKTMDWMDVATAQIKSSLPMAPSLPHGKLTNQWYQWQL